MKAILAAIAITLVGIGIAGASLASGVITASETALYAPYDPRCKLVEDSAEAYAHARAEGVMPGLHEWEHRPPAFRGDFSAGVKVTVGELSHIHGRINHVEITIRTEAEYKTQVAKQHYHSRIFLQQALHILFLPTTDGRGDKVVEVEEGNSRFADMKGGNIQHWFIVGDTPSFGHMYCFQVYGAGLPTPTPTPTPEPVEDAEADGEAS